MTPTEWFNQFTLWDITHPESTTSQWCGRHWAPCPCLGANGIGAATEVLQRIIDKHEIGGSLTVKQRNRKLTDIGRLCCDLGDEVMYQVWANWPPTGMKKHEST